MKNLLKSCKIAVVCLVSMTIVLASCKKDDDPEKSNELNYKGNKYNLDAAELKLIGQVSSTSYYYILNFTSEGADLNTTLTDTIINLTFEGEGNILIFPIFSDSPNRLTEGTYNFDPYFSALPFTFIPPDFIYSIFLDFNFYTATGIQSYLNSGNIIVNRTESEYEIEINGKDPSGNDVIGYYKGPISME